MPIHRYKVSLELETNSLQWILGVRTCTGPVSLQDEVASFPDSILEWRLGLGV